MLTVRKVVADVGKFVEEVIGSQHPVIFLQEKLSTQQAKLNIANLMAPKMVQAVPDMMDRITQEIDPVRATQDAGHQGRAHALMLSFEQVTGTTLSAFQRGLVPPEKIYKTMYRSLDEGLDTSSRSLQLAVSRRYCGIPLAKKMYFAG